MPTASFGDFGTYRRGGFVVSMNTERRGQLRGAGGRFAPHDAAALIRVNQEAAIEVQADVVRQIYNRVQRRAVSTGRLEQTTADPKNRYADRFGWGVGLPSFLDKSNAKYWRQIEEGTDIHVGREIRGFWGGSIRGFYTNRWGTVPAGGGPYSAHGGGNEGKFIPRAKGSYFDSDTGQTYGFKVPGRDLTPIRKTTIQNPIEAMGAYDAAYYGEGKQQVRKTVETARDTLLRAVEQTVYFNVRS